MLKSLSCLFAVAIASIAAYPCSLMRDPSTVEMVAGADAIVRVINMGYVVPPANPNVFTNAEPDSTVLFKVLEVIRGPKQSELTLHGYVTEVDDFNDAAPPYNFVRPTGRSGSCFTYSYRSGAQFLLFLKKKPSGEFTPAWYTLGPVNEQLHSENDPWITWVRREAKKSRSTSK